MKGVELLDDPHADPKAVADELRDIARINGLFGGTRAVIRELETLFQRSTPSTWTLLDIGTGLGDIPHAAAKAAQKYGISLRLIGVEINRAAAATARKAYGSELRLVIADGNALPFAPGSVDIVIASQVLHHLPSETAVRWIAAFAVLARRAVVLADLRRSMLAMALLWLVSFPLGLSALTRRDGVLSLQRGYTRAEFNALLAAAGAPRVARRRPGFRMVASWETRC
jgi:hypothetical protein